MQNTKALLVTFAAFALTGATPLLAQTKQVTVNATVAQVLNLTVDNTAVKLAFLAADYDVTTGLATKTAANSTTFSVTANRDWSLSVRPGGPAFSFTPTGTAVDPVKPVSDLSVRTGEDAYKPLVAATDVVVTTGSRGGYGKPGNVIPVDYQLTSDLALDPPGAYALTLTYTLVAR